MLTVYVKKAIAVANVILLELLLVSLTGWTDLYSCNGGLLTLVMFFFLPISFLVH